MSSFWAVGGCNPPPPPRNVIASKNIHLSLNSIWVYILCLILVFILIFISVRSTIVWAKRYWASRTNSGTTQSLFDLISLFRTYLKWLKLHHPLRPLSSQKIVLTCEACGRFLKNELNTINIWHNFTPTNLIGSYKSLVTMTDNVQLSKWVSR